MTAHDPGRGTWGGTRATWVWRSSFSKVEGLKPAIGGCGQIPDRTARRWHAALARWCSGVAQCCSLRSELRSRGSGPAPCVMTKAGVPLTPRSAQPCFPVFDMRRDLAAWCAAGARLSSPLSSARAGGDHDLGWSATVDADVPTRPPPVRSSRVPGFHHLRSGNAQH